MKSMLLWLLNVVLNDPLQATLWLGLGVMVSVQALSTFRSASRLRAASRAATWDSRPGREEPPDPPSHPNGC
jgi:hypothetical protein